MTPHLDVWAPQVRRCLKSAWSRDAFGQMIKSCMLHLQLGLWPVAVIVGWSGKEFWSCFGGVLCEMNSERCRCCSSIALAGSYLWNPFESILGPVDVPSFLLQCLHSGANSRTKCFTFHLVTFRITTNRNNAECRAKPQKMRTLQLRHRRG